MDCKPIHVHVLLPLQARPCLPTAVVAVATAAFSNVAAAGCLPSFSQSWFQLKGLAPIKCSNVQMVARRQLKAPIA